MEQICLLLGFFFFLHFTDISVIIADISEVFRLYIGEDPRADIIGHVEG